MKNSSRIFLILGASILMMSLMFAQTTYYSTGSLDPTTLANWNTARDGSGTAPDNFTTAGDVFIIQGTGGGSGAPHSMTAGSAWAVGTSGNGVTLRIESGATLQSNAATTISSSSSFIMEEDATYIHNNTSGYASTILNGAEDFHTGSNFIIINSATTGPGTPLGGFGNLTYNVALETPINVNSSGALTNIKGNLTIASTATGQFRLTGATALTLNIGGNLNIQGGNLTLGNGSASPVINLSGDFNMSAGVLQTIATGGTTEVPNISTINFVKNGTQTFTKTGGTITAAAASFRRISFVVASGSTLDMGTNILDALSTTNCDFTVSSGGTVRLGDPGGIVAQGSSATTGNIQTPSTSLRSFSTGGNYEYTGSSAQITGTGLPSTVNNLTVANSNGVTLSGNVVVNGTFTRTAGNLSVNSSTFGYGSNGTLRYNGAASQTTTDVEFPTAAGPTNLTIDNTSGVELHAPRTIAGILTFVNGRISTGESTLTVGESGSVTGAAAAKYVDGTLARSVPSSGSPTVSFDIGDATNFTPVSVSFNELSASGTITASTASAEHPAIAASGISPGKSVNRYWTLTNTTAAFTDYSATFNFVPGDVDEGANTSNFAVAKYNDPNWTLPTVGTRTATSTQGTGLTSFSDFVVGEAIPPAGTILSNGTGGGDWNTASTWQGGVVPTAVDTVVILGSDSVYVLAASSCADLTVQTGGRLGLSANLSTDDAHISGHVTVLADTLLASEMTVKSTGVYTHARNGGRIPIATWDVGSICEITGVTSTGPTNRNQTYHHLVLGGTLSGNVNMAYNIGEATIGGNVTIQSADGTPRWQLCAPTAGNSVTLTINGHIFQTSGNFEGTGTGNGTTTIVINVLGDISVTGGNFSVARGSQGGTGTTTWNLHGNFSMSNATTQNSNPTGARFAFAKQGGVQSLTLANITYGGGGLPIRVDSAATLNMGTTVLGGNGTFTLSPGATLQSGHALGVNGNIATSGTISLSESARYVYNGLEAQFMGSIVPATIASLTINNPNGVYLEINRTVSGVLNLVSGIITTPNTLGVAAGGVVNRTSGHVNGNLTKSIVNGVDSLNFEVGDSEYYTPIFLRGSSYSGSFAITATALFGDHWNIGASGFDTSRLVHRTFVLNGTPTGPSDITFNFVESDLDPDVNTNNLTIERYVEGWTPLAVGTRTPTSIQALGVDELGAFSIGEPLPLPPTTVISNGTGGGEWSSGSTWVGGVAPGEADTVIIVGSDSVFVQTAVRAEILTVQSNAKLALFAKLRVDDVTLNGWISVHADTLHVSGEMNVKSGAIYQHARNGGQIPIGEWEVESTILFTGITANSPAGGNQDFYNVVWNCPAQAGNLNLGWNGNTIGGNIYVLSTGAGRWQMCAPTAGSSATVTIMGDVHQSGGSFTTNGTGNGTTTIEIHHHGNINVTGGNFSISRGSQGGTGTSTWFLHGDFSMSNATTQNSNTAGAKFVMTKVGEQSIMFANDSLGSTFAVPIDIDDGSVTTLSLTDVNYAGRGFPIVVRGGGTLVMNSTVFAGNGAFTLSDNAYLRSGHPNGLGGNLATTGAKNLSINASYVFNGSVAQVTDSLPGAARTLTIDNPAGVSLSSSVLLSDSLVLHSGIFTLGESNVNAGKVGGYSAGSYARTNGSGVLTVRNVGSSPAAFPVGTATSYAPVWIANTGTVDDFSVSVVSDSGGTKGGGRVKTKWNISEATAGGTNATLRLGWMAATEDSIFAANREANAKIFLLTDTTQAGSGDYTFQLTAEPYSVSRGGFSILGAFAVGNFDFVSSVSGQPEGVPTVFAMHQNYPNPFNPSTTIKFDIPKESRVSLKVYDVMGREVAELVNGDKQAGFHSVVWNAQSLSSGVYYYRIVAGDFVTVKKLMLVK